MSTAMSGNNSRRRFIAGAVCPRCSAMDKIVVDLDSDCRECVSCGFSEARSQLNVPPAEPVTRVGRAAARRVETAPQVINLVDPRKDKTSDSDD